MVSKTILVCLAVVASISMIQATDGSGFAHCVGGPTYINREYGLGFLVYNLLSGVLNLARNLIDSLFSAIIGGGKVSYVAPPATLSALAQVNVKLAPIFGRLCGKQFDSNYWDDNIFADINVALTAALVAKLNLNIDDFAFVKVGVSLDDCRTRVKKYSSYLNGSQFQSSQWADAIVLINDYLSVVLNDEITVDLYVSALIKYFKIHIALFIMDGNYQYVDQYADAWVQACNGIFQKQGGAFSGKVITKADLAVNVPQKCGCIKK